MGNPIHCGSMPLAIKKYFLDCSPVILTRDQRASNVQALPTDAFHADLP
jgi:hypothetical protein